MKEAPIQQRIRLAAAQAGVDLWRNNVGACQDATGRLIRYGLCNDSAALAARVKSSDLIGVTPLLIQPNHVGYVVGVFTAIETKASEWVYSVNDDRAVAQNAFHDIIRNAGGFAGFARSIEDFKRITGK